ncbi:LOW QUALITY PROTEIN: melanophilin [Suncus etruscus]|uniref:LOW QUALITY PROTEIN: melanophilin n=1 Tax=Suncus etruscus TaxID=109475 RepID=UPI00210FEEBB|nr:LOW QUALITY PROTEIN: melanophilin [Suncus etruscus]
MGRKMDLSQLTDAEAQHVWEVIQRDLDLRRKEEARLHGLKGEIQKERDQNKHALLLDAAHLSQTHCACCLQPYELHHTPRSQCMECGLFTCQFCGLMRQEEQSWLCSPCHLARVVQFGSLEWYYRHLRARFKRFGSAKVIQSLSERLQGTGRAELSTDEEQTDEEADPYSEPPAQQPGNKATPLSPHSPKTRRRLSIHDLDLLDSQDATSTPTGNLEVSPTQQDTSPSLQIQNLWTDLGGNLKKWRQALTGEPSSEESMAEEVDINCWGQHPSQKEQVGYHPQDGLSWHHLPAESSEMALSIAAYPDQGSHSHEAPQGLGAEVSTEADREEAELRRKLAQMSTYFSDPTDEDEEAHAEHVEDGGELRQKSHPQSPGNSSKVNRTTDEELMELEGKVAAAASEVQQSESEVTYIQSRIAALRAAGLTVQSTGTPQRKSNLPILLPRKARASVKSTRDQQTEAPKQDQVCGNCRDWACAERVATAPSPQEAKFKDSHSGLGSNFERESLYRMSLTQRNPTRRKGTAHLGFAVMTLEGQRDLQEHRKPVMSQQPGQGQ